jgi:hypothetical protein
MSNPVELRGCHFRLRLGVFTLLSVIFWLIDAFPNNAWAEKKSTAANLDSEEADNWLFDNAPYTNSPKTGKRVDQYRAEKTPYRDPNALYDSPMSLFSFMNYSDDSLYELYPYYLNGILPGYGNSFHGDDLDSDSYYPYDSDPNDDDNRDQ